MKSERDLKLQNTVEAYQRNIRCHTANIQVARAWLNVLKDIRRGNIQTDHMPPGILEHNLWKAAWAVRCEQKWRRRDQDRLNEIIGKHAWARKKAKLNRKHKQNPDQVVHHIEGFAIMGKTVFAVCGYPCQVLPNDEPWIDGGHVDNAEQCRECQELHGGPF